LATHKIQYQTGLRIPKEQGELRIARKGSFLLCIEGGSAGKKVAMLSQDACFVNKLCCFSSEKNNNFKYYFAQTHNFKDKFELSMTGLIGGVSTSLLKQFSIPTPSKDEQTAIVTFLDCETVKLDALVTEQQRLIALLSEKRQAVISHAVTQGLNADVPMKPSGIGWLGDVPAHWEVSAIKRYAEKITDGAHVSPETENGVFHFVSTKDVGTDSIDFENCLRTSEQSYESMVKTGCRPVLGDVLFSKDGTIGRTVVIREDREFAVASSLIIIRPTATILDSEFLHYLCQSQGFANQVDCFVKGAGLPRLSIQNLTKVVGCFPPVSEQKEIAQYLASELAKFDTLTTEAQRGIDLMQERRTALISAAVTGQIDVRDAVPAEFKKAVA
jgi:type I restriction enzyme, S subunit